MVYQEKFVAVVKYDNAKSKSVGIANPPPPKTIKPIPNTNFTDRF